jgi:hypothetical protein
MTERPEIETVELTASSGTEIIAALQAASAAAAADYRQAYLQLRDADSLIKIAAWRQEHRQRMAILSEIALFLATRIGAEQRAAEQPLVDFFWQLQAAYSYLLLATPGGKIDWRLVPETISAPVPPAITDASQ